MKTIAEVRRELKKLGFKVSVRTLSWGPHGSFFNRDGEQRPTIFHGEEDRHPWAPLIAYINHIDTGVCTKDGTWIYGFWKDKPK